MMEIKLTDEDRARFDKKYKGGIAKLTDEQLQMAKFIAQEEMEQRHGR